MSVIMEHGETGDAVAADVIEGECAIARFLFGSAATRTRARTVLRHGLPHFRIGNRIFARKSIIAGWIETQEHRQG